jgi:hypothetical protein
MEANLSKLLIQTVLSELEFNKIIITTPNYDFNKHYKMDTEYRHEDHKWELTKEKFREYLEDILKTCETKLKVTYIDIGDQVDGDSVSQGAIITKN